MTKMISKKLQEAIDSPVNNSYYADRSWLVDVSGAKNCVVTGHSAPMVGSFYCLWLVKKSKKFILFGPEVESFYLIKTGELDEVLKDISLA